MSDLDSIPRCERCAAREAATGLPALCSECSPRRLLTDQVFEARVRGPLDADAMPVFDQLDEAELARLRDAADVDELHDAAQVGPNVHEHKKRGLWRNVADRLVAKVADAMLDKDALLHPCEKCRSVERLRSLPYCEACALEEGLQP